MIDDCCRTCLACHHNWCAAIETSPGEDDGLCLACWEADNDGHDALAEEHTGIPGVHCLPCAQDAYDTALDAFWARNPLGSTA